MMQSTNYDLCYPILEKDMDSIIKKIREVKNKNVKMYELRIDCLKDILYGNIDIKSLVEKINNLKIKFPSKKMIATIRTKSEGGNIDLSYKRYFNCITYMLKGLKIDYVDIEYKYYEKYKTTFDKLIRESKVKTIISKHIFDKKYSDVKCKKHIQKLSKTPCDIVKIAVMVESRVSAFKFMELSQNCSDKLLSKKRRGIFIAMGKEGIISRVFPEYTGTKIVFLNAYGNKNTKLYQPSLTFFLHFHCKILDYLDK